MRYINPDPSRVIRVTVDPETDAHVYLSPITYTRAEYKVSVSGVAHVLSRYEQWLSIRSVLGELSIPLDQGPVEVTITLPSEGWVLGKYSVTRKRTLRG